MDGSGTRGAGGLGWIPCGILVVGCTWCVARCMVGSTRLVKVQDHSLDLGRAFGLAYLIPTQATAHGSRGPWGVGPTARRERGKKRDKSKKKVRGILVYKF